jgi:hypothetical protein
MGIGDQVRAGIEDKFNDAHKQLDGKLAQSMDPVINLFR